MPAQPAAELDPAEAAKAELMQQLRDEEAELDRQVKSMVGAKTARGIANRAALVKDLTDVRHRITALKPPKLRVETLSNALEKAIIRREELKAKVEAANETLAEASDACNTADDELATQISDIT